jgi:hypothetical protein
MDDRRRYEGGRNVVSNANEQKSFELRSSRKLRYAVIFMIVVGLLLGAAYNIWGRRKGPEARLQADIDELSKDGHPGEFIKQFDLICFNFSNNNVVEEFNRESLRLGQNFSSSLKSCGVERTCCNLRSDAGGFVGLVRGEEIECLEVNKFTFWPAGDRPICAKPSELSIEHRPYTGPEHPAGRPWISRPGSPSYTIVERKQ